MIAGIPACGKTTFGDYLRDKKDFFHLDMESFEGTWHHRIWDASLKIRDLSLFIETLKREGRPVVLTWGFHTQSIDIVEALKKLGVIIWWFDGDPSAARIKFIERGTGDIANFDAQMSRIRADFSAIQQRLIPNVVSTLGQDGSRKAHESIWTEIQEK